MILTTADPPEVRLCCPACGRFIAAVTGTVVECPPCKCGVQTTVRLAGRRARALVGTPAGILEVKAAH